MQYWINLIGVPYEHLFPIAAEAEQLGFTGLALADHLAVPTVIESPYPGGARPWTEADDWPDVWVTIGAMAAVTSRLRFVTNVYIAPLRHPLIIAKAVGTASVISNGRVIFGAGIGWMLEEFDSVASSFRTRGKRTNEILRILRDAWEHYRMPIMITETSSTGNATARARWMDEAMRLFLVRVGIARRLWISPGSPS